MGVSEPGISYCVCYKGIPLDAAFTPGKAEYVEHLRGLECYQYFQARANTTTGIGAKPDACDLPPSG